MRGLRWMGWVGVFVALGACSSPGGVGSDAGGDPDGVGDGGTDGDAGPPPPGACVRPTASDPDIGQMLPQAYVDTTFVPPTGNTIAVAAGGNLQTALDSAQPGDVVTIE